MMQLDDDQWGAAREQARLEGLSLAAFVRKAIDERLARAEQPRSIAKRRALDAIDRVSDTGHWPPDDVDTGRAAPRDAAVADAPVHEPSDVSPDAIGGTAQVPRCWLDNPLEDAAP